MVTGDLFEPTDDMVLYAQYRFQGCMTVADRANNKVVAELFNYQRGRGGFEGAQPAFFLAEGGAGGHFMSQHVDSTVDVDHPVMAPLAYFTSC